MGAGPKVGMSFAHADGTEVRPKRRCAFMKVLIGVDPHKTSLAVAAVDEATGELLERTSVPQDHAGLRSLERWAKRFPERSWAMENAGGLGRHLAGRLVAVDPEAASEVLSLLSERREDLVAERTRALNRLHGLLRVLVPGGVAGKLSARRAARILRGIRPRGGASDRLRRRLASEVLRDVRTLDRKIADLDGRIEAEVEASGTTLTQIFGVGAILAARIIGTVGNVARFPTKAHFASYAGTA